MGSKYVIIILALLLCTGCKEQIIHNLSEKEANRLLTKLHAGDLSPSKVKQADGTWAISVDKGEILQALKYLDDSRMLRSKSGILPKSSSMISSREQQQLQYERSRAAEIESTLSSVEGVLEARVHLNIEKVDPLLGRPKDSADKSTASVLLVTTPQFAIEKEEVASLIAGAAGISPVKVVVLIHPAATHKLFESADSQIAQLDSSGEYSFGGFSAAVRIEDLVMILGGVLFVIGIILLTHSLMPKAFAWGKKSSAQET